MAGEALSGELAIRTELRGWQFDRVLDDRLVVGGTTDLDDFEVGRTLQHPVPDAGWLQDAVACLEHERFTLVLVDQPHPTLGAEDHLEADVVEMDVVGDRAGVRDVDVGGDEAAAESSGDQIAVPHAGPSDDPPRAVVQTVDHQLLGHRWNHDRRIGGDDLDDGAVRRDDVL